MPLFDDLPEPADAKARERVRELRGRINRANELYYNQAAPELTDDRYDALLAELARLEREHPELDAPDSPTRRVGAPARKPSKKEAFAPHRHAVPMLSIANTYSSEEIRKFVGRVEGALREAGAPDAPRFVVELKIDGVALAVFYRDGAFRLGATRGDGTTGEDITGNLKAVEKLPKSLAKPFPGGDVEVRGEIYLPAPAFARLVEEQEERGAERVFANPRNAAAGTLKLLDPSIVAGRGLDCFFYQIAGAGDIGANGQADALLRLEGWGLPVNPLRRTCSNADEILAFRDEMDLKRHALQYGTDGLVVKVDSFAHQETLGLGSRSPNWAVAYKFRPDRAETTVEGIRVQVGKLGRLTPVADLAPVTLSGSTITHASLHNESYIRERDVRIGDRVLVEKAGEIIPQIAGVMTAGRPGNAEPFIMPTECPSCHAESSTTGNRGPDGRTVVLRFCPNPACPAKRLAKIVHFASRDAMDIEGMGPSVVSWLLDHSLIANAADIYRLTRGCLMPMTKEGRELAEGGGEPTKMAENLLAAIERSKGRGLAKLLFALSIPDVGETAAQVLARRFKSLDALADAREDEISAVPMGESTAYRTLGAKAANELAKRLADVPDGDAARVKSGEGLAEYLESLRIPGFARKKCEAAARAFGSLDRLRKAGPDELALVEMGASSVKRTLGPVAAASLRAFLDDPGHREILDRLRGAGVVMEDASAPEAGGAAGRVFVLTGTLPNLGRAEAKRLIEAAGGLVAGGVSGKVDYLVAGSDPGSKLGKARELGVDIIDEADMLRIVKG
ncbi:MAG: NAD-dependent DNA ligase LigA [Planctomycetota bacterium]|jgi:DNA ligase (NAD+)|nr:NAD-dependent DNA ligase LigA [Planctomycetota bacterium]